MPAESFGDGDVGLVVLDPDPDLLTFLHYQRARTWLAWSQHDHTVLVDMTAQRGCRHPDRRGRVLDERTAGHHRQRGANDRVRLTLAARLCSTPTNQTRPLEPILDPTLGDPSRGGRVLQRGAINNHLQRSRNRRLIQPGPTTHTAPPQSGAVALTP